MSAAVDAILAKLAAAPAVTNIAGTRFELAGMVSPATARPLIVVQTIGTGRLYDNAGPSGVARSTVQLTCYANGYGTARQLANAVRTTLNGFRGTVGQTKVLSILLDDERDAAQPPSGGSDRGVPGVLLIFIVAVAE